MGYGAAMGKKIDPRELVSGVVSLFDPDGSEELGVEIEEGSFIDPNRGPVKFRISVMIGDGDIPFLADDLEEAAQIAILQLAQFFLSDEDY